MKKENQRNFFQIFAFTAAIIFLAPSCKDTPENNLVPFTAVKVSAGQFHNLAIREDGSLWAWGFNQSGSEGDGTTANRRTSVHVMVPR